MRDAQDLDAARVGACYQPRHSIERGAVTSAPVTAGNWATSARGRGVRASGGIPVAAAAALSRFSTPTYRGRSVTVGPSSGSVSVASHPAPVSSPNPRQDSPPREPPREREIDRETVRSERINGEKHTHRRTTRANVMSPATRDELDETAVENFREYLRIPSVQPDVDYGPCVEFITRQAKSLDLPVRVYHVHPKKPIVVLTWLGTQPTKPSVLLNSHMDVVPVFEDKWTYPPFSAHMDEEGNIYARGSQDMKCVGIEYLEAIRRLKLQGVRCERTVHVSFVPDEEIGGVLGMKEFVHTEDFKALNVGFALDEGVSCPEEFYYLFYAERSIWHVEVRCAGNPGHGSILMDNTAGEKLRVVLDRFTDFRAGEREKLKDPKNATQLGDVTTINLTKVWGGVQANVLPEELGAMFDIRLAPTVDHEEFEGMIKRWCEEAGTGVTYSFEQKEPKVEGTRLDSSNPFWLAFKRTCDEMGAELKIGVFPGGTDSRFVRGVGVPAICFSPINKTKILLHDNNEYLNKTVLLRGIEVYTKIIPAVANV